MTRIFPYKENIFLIREKTGQKKPIFWHNSRSECLKKCHEELQETLIISFATMQMAFKTFSKKLQGEVKHVAACFFFQIEIITGLGGQRN